MNRNSKAMTLIEVMTALAITAMIGTATTSVTVALFNAQDSTDAYTENVQAGRMSLGQLQALIGTSRLITEGDATTMTLWAFDSDDPGVINSDELVRLRFDQPSGTIQQIYVEFDPSLDDDMRAALNIPLSLADCTDWDQASNVLSESRISDTIIATGITAVTFRYDTAPPFTRLIAIEATFGDGTQAVIFHTGTAIRAPATEWVRIKDHMPLLDAPDSLVPVLPVGNSGEWDGI